MTGSVARTSAALLVEAWIRSPRDELSRRGFLTAVTAAGLLTACNSDTTSSPSTPGAGPWRFIDDRDVTVTLPSRPTRIVANDQAGAALTSLGVRPVGIFGGLPGPTGQRVVH